MANDIDVLLVGGGGREHALAWKLRESKRVDRLYCAPGNGGIAALAEIVPIAADDVPALVDFAAQKKVGLVVVGPELPLTLGLVDALAARGIRAFGPTKEGAQLEGSKAFTKEILHEARVSTARFQQFREAQAARDYVRRRGVAQVIKADGLAAGKGVIVNQTVEDTLASIDRMLADPGLRDACKDGFVLEDLLPGEEASFLALTDGQTVVPLASSQDHKRIFDGDQGPNTGGMGAISPTPLVTPAIERRVVEDLEQVVAVLKSRGIVYKGVLYAGLMIDRGVPSVLEFNCRFGDPECQPLMVRLKTDLVDVCDAVIDGRLHELKLDWDRRAAACVVVAAPGYPGTVQKGAPIEGLGEADRVADCMVFHAGTKRAGDAIVTDGGRVLGVTALGDTLDAALARAYEAVAHIRFPGMQFRRDIGRHAVGRAAGGRAG